VTGLSAAALKIIQKSIIHKILKLLQFKLKMNSFAKTAACCDLANDAHVHSAII